MSAIQLTEELTQKNIRLPHDTSLQNLREKLNELVHMAWSRNNTRPWIRSCDSKNIIWHGMTRQTRRKNTNNFSSQIIQKYSGVCWGAWGPYITSSSPSGVDNGQINLYSDHTLHVAMECKYKTKTNWCSSMEIKRMSARGRISMC